MFALGCWKLRLNMRYKTLVLEYEYAANIAVALLLLQLLPLPCIAKIAGQVVMQNAFTCQLLKQGK